MGAEELREQRVRKLAELREAGYQPYANDFRPEVTCLEVHRAHGQHSAEELEGESRIYTVAGRVISLRKHGKSTFLNIQDRSGSIQIFVKKDTVGENTYNHLKTADLGDVIGVAGSPMRTRTGELSVAAEGLRILTKALRPPPEKWHGLTDVDTRYRQRYVDLFASPEVRDIFRRRATIINTIRQALDTRDFLEVETPILQEMAGGAAAQPFVTHYNALGADCYLRIATELHLKRLVVGGLERVYEIGRCFRNEGLSRKHNPEFTSLELYQAYATAADHMDLTEELLVLLTEQLAEDLRFPYQGAEISLERRPRRVCLADAVCSHLGVDSLRETRSIAEACAAVYGHTVDHDPIEVLLANLDDDEVKALIPGLEGETPAELAASARARYSATDDNRDALLEVCRGLDEALDETRARGAALHMLFACFEHEVESTLVQPTFVTDYPLAASPLSRQHDHDPAVVDRFELFIGGMEIANAFSELTDPIEQRARFERQLRLRARGDAEAHAMDEDFIRALEIGMPPTAGEGIGIDRLTMLFCDAPSIREVILFPQLRREVGAGEGADSEE